MRLFNLYSRPYTVACVDDDPTFIDLLQLALSNNFQVKFFTQSQPMIDFINESSAQLTADYNQFRKIFDPLNDAVSTIQLTLQYWKNNNNRQAFVEVVVLDYAMPKMNGLQLLSHLNQWKGVNILLTGVADETVAVQAFNDGIIHRYIPKQNNEIIDNLILNIKGLQPRFFTNYQSLCESSLSYHQLQLLNDSNLQKFLATFAKDNWIEYIVLPKPFGILGLDSKHNISFLQIETRDNLVDLVTIASLENWNADTLKQIESGTILANSLVRQALNNQIKPMLSQANQVPHTNIITAYFKLE